MNISPVEWAMNIAKTVSLGSEDRRLKVGAVAFTREWRIISTGYNGFPPGVDLPLEADRDPLGYPQPLHAEMNCCAGFRRLEAAIMVVTARPCPTCINQLAAIGISKVYYSHDWGDDEAFAIIEQTYKQTIRIIKV